VSERSTGIEQPTILLVEDDAQVRKLVSEWLRRSGYIVQECSCAAEAVRVFAQQNGHISLLVTDVDLAEGMSGNALAERIQTLRPELRVVLISGLPQNVTRLRDGWHFVPKPFAPADLLAEVEAALSEDTGLRTPADQPAPVESADSCRGRAGVRKQAPNQIADESRSARW